MFYQFSEDKEANEVVAEADTLTGLKRSVHEYYKGKAMDAGDDEWQADGYITTLDQFGDVVSFDPYYGCGMMPLIEKDRSMFFQGGFI